MAIRVYGNKSFFAGGTEQTDPPDDTVMADTGELTEGKWEFRITAGASAAAQFAVQHRNASNSSNVFSTVIYIPAGVSGQYLFYFSLIDDQRVRVIMDNALTGDATVSINYEKLL